MQPRAVTAPRAPSPLRLLFLGGTGFIGPHMVRYAVERGHHVTLFNRGRTNSDLFPELDTLIGDRNGDLTALEGRSWDAVIDNSATNPRWVRLSARLLAGSVGRYVFTSTASVYSDLSIIGIGEDSRTHEPDPSAIDEDRQLPYGQAKSTCEFETRRAFPDSYLIFRPGLIVGPGDPTDRFTYWPVRIDRGGEVLAPGDRAWPVKFIDARDLAAFYIHEVEAGTVGTYNLVGPEARLSMAEMLSGIRAATKASVTFTWVDADFLLERGVRPWSDLPVWIPARGDTAGFHTFDASKAIARGLRFRPLADTARDTIAFHHARPAAERATLRAGLPAERESQLLSEWKRRA